MPNRFVNANLFSTQSFCSTSIFLQGQVLIAASIQRQNVYADENFVKIKNQRNAKHIFIKDKGLTKQNPLKDSIRKCTLKIDWAFEEL